MTVPLYKLKNDSNCFRNDHCLSGNCKEGKCSDPEALHDSCRPLTQNCPKGLQCSERSRTCIPASYKINSSCKTVSDCAFNEICFKGNCRKTIPLGQICHNSNKFDFCVKGSKCTLTSFKDEHRKCFEHCGKGINCPRGYKCTKDILSNSDELEFVCIPITNNNNNPSSSSSSVTKNVRLTPEETISAVLLVFAVIIIILGGLYGWIRCTRSAKDPRLISSSKRKRKRLRLNYEGNGLATITVIPSTCQSPQPVAASQLFQNNPIIMSDPSSPPPAYSEIINIS